MNIRTQEHKWAPPSMRWSAVDDDGYDYDSPIGWGASEDAAIDDLLGLVARDDELDGVLYSERAADYEYTGEGMDVAE